MPADAAGIAKVHVDTWRTAYPKFMSATLLANLSYEERTERHAKSLEDESIRSRYFVAQSSKAGIVGFVCGGANRGADNDVFTAELYAIYVSDAFQGHGLGRRLVHAWARRTYEQGYRSAKLWVIRDNSASRKFYESVGAVLVTESHIDPIDEIEPIAHSAYGWLDLRVAFASSP